ncbi:protein kinase [Streptomyces sp. AcE210]|uniref:protein kinase domain-containing protein n=1 Tax=Streptomyces sp. AcE210 TaxID=2292703 RepID=UPI000E30A1E0|nr:protein kinase [Streptomyces sp. AcE210]RFC77825.1 serine/threonine protein kinase [Streptomyces sp. AcE210]
MSSTNRDERDDSADGGIKPLAAFDPVRIGPYLLLGRLGAGGMGRVFLARSESGRTVAVKVVHEEHVSDERFRARFRREIDAAQRVGERYTAPVLDSGPDDDPPWVATGYVPGLSLEQVVRRHGPLPTASVRAVADGLLRALKDIHDAGIVHRDLKPSNVMLTVDGTKVIDFGIARALETSAESPLTSTGMAVGSPGFMSPEQIQAQSVGPKSDVFTLGSVLMYAATGRLPFGHEASNQHAVMFQIVQDEPDLDGVDDPALRALISRCLTKDAGQRPDVHTLLADPDLVKTVAAKATLLPADVVAHLAQQSARLLDAEAAPHRAEPVDRSTVGLRPQPGPPETVPTAGGSTTPKPEPRPARRRRTLIVLPIIAVITIGGGAVTLLQPFGGGSGDGTHAKSPQSSTSATPDGSKAPSKAGRSPSGKGNGKDGKDGKEQQGNKDEQSAAKPKESTGSSASPGGADGADTNGGSDSGATSSGSGSSASGGGGSSGAGGSSTGSPPPALKSYSAKYTNSCVGACSMPILVSWSAISRATRYDIHYTNKGSQYTKKNVDTIHSTGNTSYTITGPYSGDEICLSVRAANKYGASAWAETWCTTVPY